MSQAQRLELSLAMQTEFGLSARRADRVLSLSRSARHYRLRVRDDGPLIEAMQAGVQANPGYGFGLLFSQTLRPHGWGKTRYWRVYTDLRLNLPRRASGACQNAFGIRWRSRQRPTTRGRRTS